MCVASTAVRDQLRWTEIEIERMFALILLLAYSFERDAAVRCKVQYIRSKMICFSFGWERCVRGRSILVDRQITVRLYARNNLNTMLNTWLPHFSFTMFHRKINSLPQFFKFTIYLPLSNFGALYRLYSQNVCMIILRDKLWQKKNYKFWTVYFLAN